MKNKFYLLFICLIALQFAVNAQDRIFWGVPSSNISSARLDGSDIQKSVNLAAQTYDMESDFYKNVLYWGEGGSVKKANWDGSGGQTLYTVGSKLIGALALDLTNNKLYFSQFGGGANVIIMKCNLDGTGQETVLISPNAGGSTYTLSISPSLQKLYWSEQNVSGNRVFRCNLDGTSIETLLTVANFIPGMTIDEKNQKLYLAYWQDNEVRTTNMTCSTSPTLVFNNSFGTFQMSVSNIENKLYFAQMNKFKICKCNLDGTSPQDVVTLASGQIMALSVPTVPQAPTIIENEKYTFVLKDFLFSGIDKDLITKIQISANVDKGTLYLDANSNDVVDEGEIVAVNGEILKADIVAGLLKYVPVADEFGTPYTSFKFKWFNGTEYSALEFTQYIYVLEYIAGDKNKNGIIDNGEITGDINLDGTINRPTEVAGDRDGNGVIDNPLELAGDVNGDGIINRPTEIAGDLNGNGVIDIPDEAAGDVNGDGTIFQPELAGDLNGDGTIVAPELLDDTNGNGLADDIPGPTATTNTAGSITSSGATLNGSINANNTGTIVTFEYGLTTAYGSTVTADQSPVTGITTTSVRKAITGLTANTIYHYKVVAVNAGGTTHGSDVSFTTSAVAPTVVTNAATSITSVTATLNGTVNANNASTAVTFEYGLTTAYGTIVTASPSPVSGTSNTAATYSLSGLAANKTYHFRVVGTNTAGTVNGSDLSFTTITSADATPQYYNYNTNGTGNNSYPFNIAAGKEVQLLYLPGDFSAPSLSPAGMITSIAFRIADSYPLGPWDYTNLTIKMGQVASLTSFNAGELYTGTLSTVYYHATTTLSGNVGKWMTIPLDTPFSYDPSQSLIVEIGQCGVPGGTGYSMCVTNLSNNRRNYSVGGCPFTYNGQGSSVYHMGINIIASTSPIVVTTAATSVSTNSATLNGTVNANNQSSTVTFEYGTTTSYGSTVTADQSPVTGSTAVSVSKAITGLTSNTIYHYRVIGVNEGGTTYGSDITFTTLAPPVPVITSFTPVTGTIGTSVTITGTGFSSTASDNTVYFGAVKATASSSTVTSITVKVPAGSGSVVPLSVTTGGLTATSITSSTPVFDLTNTSNLAPVFSSSTLDAQSNPYSIANGDLNNDNITDIAIVNYESSSLSIYLGNGDGGFGTIANYEVAGGPVSVQIADFNRDGNMDIATGNHGSSEVSILLGSGNGSFGAATNFVVGSNPYSIALGDFNKDGIIDIVCANLNGRNVSILLGNGAGSFAAATNFSVGARATSVAVGDFNKDGKEDLVVAKDASNYVSILLGDGSGSFGAATNFVVGQSPYCVAIGDFNNDGNVDIASANAGSNNVSVLLGDGLGSFSTASNMDVGYNPVFVAVGDFDGDGKFDIAAVNQGSGSVNILPGDGAGGFSVLSDIEVGTFPSSVAIGDYNGDGLADMISTNNRSNNLTVLLNTSLNPIVSGISPTNGPTAGGTSVIITGTNLADASTVKFGSTNATSYTVNSATQITTTSPAGSAGEVDITVTTAKGTSETNSSDIYTYVDQPTISGIDPASGLTTGGTSVIITGTNLSGATSVMFGTVDASDFTVNSATQITATSPAGSAGTVDITVTTAGGTSAVSSSDQFTYIIPNSAPTDLALSVSAINENVTANSTVGSLSSTDPNVGNTFTYTLVSGTGSTDNAFFNISGSILKITNSPDFESKSSYSIRVRTTDQGSLYFEKVFTITINNVNEVPTNIALSSSSINENVAGNSAIGTLTTTDPDAGNTFTYTLVAGAGSTDNASFNISGSSLRITNSPDFETKSSYSLRVRTTDQGGLTYEKAFAVTINDLNETPTDIALSASSINENVTANSTVGTLSSTDIDASNTFTYSLVSGTGSTDNASFNISGGSLRITNSPDFETKSSYSVRVRTTDQGGLTYEKAFTVTINDLNESPMDIALSASSINENVAGNSTIGILSSTDPDASNSFTYTLVAGAGSTDNASFNFSGSSLRITSSPDFETKSSYSVRVRTTDQGSMTYEKVFTITINDLNESPTDIALSASSINENVAGNSAIGTLTTTDPDAGNTFTYTLVAGAGSTDNASFTISGNSLLITNSPDYETKSSYSIRIRTTDQGSLTYEKAFTVTIADLNDVVPVITAAQEYHVTENSPNGTTVGTVLATDGDVTATTFQNWTITSGNSKGYFTVNSATGVITVADNTGLNPFINPGFTLTLTVSDGTNTSLSETVSIVVDGVNDENPVITASQSFSIDENSANSTVVGTVLATDPDYGTVLQDWAITVGNTGSAFAINASTGVITVNTRAALDFETNGSFNLSVTVNDGLHTSAAQTVSVSLNDVNEAPTGIALSNSTINENSAANSTVGTLSSTDPDASNTFTYSLVAGNGDTDNASFTINGSSLRITSSPDFRVQNSYSVRVRTTDQGGLTYEKEFTVTVNPAPGEPTAGSNSYIYDGTEKTASATVADGITIDWYADLTGGSTISVPSGTDAGTYTAYAEARNTTTNCVSTSRTLITLEITKSMLTVTANSQTKVYGEINPELTFKYSGWKNDETESVLDTKLVAGTTVDKTTEVGTYTDAITVGSGSDNNYDFTYVANEFEVTKALLTVTADIQTKVYGDANPELTFNYSGWKNDDTESVLDSKPLANTIIDLKTEVGTYTDAITVGSGVDNNYDFTYVANDFEVTKATLTVTADAQTKIYGEANPDLTFKYAGWKNNDTESVLDTKPVANTTVDLTTAFGTYTDAITISAVVDNNYDFTYVAADFAVTKAILTIAGAKAENKVYDGNTDATITGALLTGVVGTDDVVLENYASGTFTQTGIGTAIDVTPAMTLSGASSSNYTLIQAIGLKADITAKELHVNNAVATDKVYDGTAIAEITGAKLEGVVGTENVVLSDAAAGTFAQANIGTDIEVTPSMTLTGTDIANYTLAQPAGLKANITARPITVLNSVVVTNKMVDGNTTAVVTSPGTLQSVVSSDLSSLSLSAVANYNDAGVGVNKTITVVYTLSGSAKDNYTTPVNYVISGAKISDFVVLSPVVTPTPGCEGSDLDLAYTLVSGSSSEYKITFSAAALAAGIQNVSYTTMPSAASEGIILIPIPKGTPEGNYQGTIRMRNELGFESPEYTFSFTVNLSSDYIIDKFDDVVLCDNSSNRFTTYQWYKNGIKIEGATKQFYCDPDGRVGVYSLEVVTIDGKTLISCGKGLNNPMPKKVLAYPNPMKSDEVCTVKIFGFSDEELKNSELTVFNIQGQRVHQTREVTNLNLMKLPAVPGVYIGHVTSRDGVDYVFKIVVQQ